MRKIRTALADTNVYGSLIEKKAHQKASLGTLDFIHEHNIQMYGSFINVIEFSRSAFFDDLLMLFSTYVDDMIELMIPDELEMVDKLSWNYIQQLKLKREKFSDCKLVALSTIGKLDMFITWNRRDILNDEAIRIISRVNGRWKFKTPWVITPLEFLHQISF